MLEALFPRQIPTVPVSSYPVTTPHKGWHPLPSPGQPSQQPIQMENFPFLLRPSEWGQIPSCLNCPLSAAAAGPVTKPHMKNVVNTSLRAAPLIIFWRELRSSVPSTHAGLGQTCKRCLTMFAMESLLYVISIR